MFFRFLIFTRYDGVFSKSRYVKHLLSDKMRIHGVAMQFGTTDHKIEEEETYCALDKFLGVEVPLSCSMASRKRIHS